MWLRGLVAVCLVATSGSVAAAPAAPSAPPVSDVSEEPSAPSVENGDEGPTRKSLALSAAGTAGVYLGLYGWVTLAWYVRSTNSGTFSMHEEGWFGRDTYAGGADKVGHTWGNYVMTRGVSQILQNGGWPRRASILTAGGLAFTFFAFSEVKDGYTKQYGFSTGDVLCNAIGVATGMVFELSPELDRRLDFKISYFPSAAFRARLEKDGPFNSPEDYSGQTMLLAYHLGSIDGLVRNVSWARYVDLSVGYQTRGYRPVIEGSERSQDLFAGVSLNLQGVLDRVVTGRAAGAVHFMTEMYQVPYTTLRAGALERTSPPVMTTTP
jgi:hypothetical protein